MFNLFSTTPPPEVNQLFRKYKNANKHIEGWWSVPTMRNSNTPFSRKDLQKNTVDAWELLQPLLKEKRLKGTLRTVDVFNGCGHQCDTCLANASLPSKQFSLQSLKKLFRDKRFQNMLQEDSLRFGSSGDIFDHPDTIKIITMSLWYTRKLETKIQKKTKGKKHHRIRVFTNYRPIHEEKLDQLLTLAKRHQSRLEVIISLPLNKIDTVNKSFEKYANNRPNFFTASYKNDDGFMSFETTLKNIGIQDIRHPLVLFNIGRTLSKDMVNQKGLKNQLVDTNRDTEFEQRGFVKTYLNPEALWLMVYTTIYESPTTRAFTPVNSSNLKLLSNLPWHPDFPTPPNWPGGKGVYKSTQQTLLAKINSKLKHKKKTTVVS